MPEVTHCGVIRGDAEDRHRQATYGSRMPEDIWSAISRMGELTEIREQLYALPTVSANVLALQPLGAVGDQQGRNGSANGNRTRISALKGPRANRCTIAPRFAGCVTYLE